MSDQKDRGFQYESLRPNGVPEVDDYPITPPPYSLFPDHNSYVPNPTNPANPAIPPNSTVTHVDFAGQPIYGQPMPAFTVTTDQTYPTNYGTIVQPVPQTIIFLGSCPACRVGILEEDFTCLGILMALLFFPLGLICCFALRQRRCPNCGTTFD